MKNREVVVLLFMATAAITAVTTAGCNPKSPPPNKGIITGHDTPIIVSGGSLWIWSTVNFQVPSVAGNLSQYQYYLPATNQYVSSISLYSEETLHHQVGSSVAITSGSPWTLCANPHDLKMWSPNTQVNDVVNFATARASVLPIFWPMAFGSGSGNYGFGRRHVNPNSLSSLNLKTGDANYACPIFAGAAPDCTTGNAPPCSFYCSTPQCFVKLDY